MRRGFEPTTGLGDIANHVIGRQISPNRRPAMRHLLCVGRIESPAYGRNPSLTEDEAANRLAGHPNKRPRGAASTPGSDTGGRSSYADSNANPRRGVARSDGAPSAQGQPPRGVSAVPTRLGAGLRPSGLRLPAGRAQGTGRVGAAHIHVNAGRSRARLAVVQEADGTTRCRGRRRDARHVARIGSTPRRERIASRTSSSAATRDSEREAVDDWIIERERGKIAPDKLSGPAVR